MFEDVLKSKIAALGCNIVNLDEKLSNFDFDILEKTYQDEDKINNNIELWEFDAPNVQIARNFLNVDGTVLQKALVDGDMVIKTIDTPLGIKMNIVDYKLSEMICVIILDEKLRVKIIHYNPSGEVKRLYENKYYEEVYGETRFSVANDYYEALCDAGKVSISKAKEIVYMLTSDFVIDDMNLSNLEPKLKLYDIPEKFAENITEYELKYINVRLNRIESAHKSICIRCYGKDVRAGYITNDPYIKIGQISILPIFPMNKICYYWQYSNDVGREEISIYTAKKQYEQEQYAEYYGANNTKLDKVAFEIAKKFSADVGYEINQLYIKEVLEKLNQELVVPSIKIIQEYMEEKGDQVETLKYRYKVFTDPVEFEKKLYTSIEDNMGRRYKYRIAESVNSDLTTIGNKLNYTGQDGISVKKQSIADFDVNSNTVVIDRETFIDVKSISQLLGYIYEDLEDLGTSMLPIPSMEVDFYFPAPENIGQGIKMYNGTNFEDLTFISNAHKFYTDGEMEGFAKETIEDIQEGTTKAIVRYKNSLGEILKETTINNLIAGSVYVPENIPIINDKDGKEWYYEQNQLPSIELNESGDNIVEVKYVPKMAKMVVSYINKQGKKVCESQTKMVQAGGIYEVEKEKSIVDKENNEWNYQYSIPKKLIISDDSEKNSITLVYDIIKEEVIINFVNMEGKEIRKPIKEMVVVNKKYTPKIDAIITSEDGLAWTYISKDAVSIMVKQNEKNSINLVYDELKAKVITEFCDDTNKKIIDDFMEFAQVGSFYKAKFEEKIFDYENRKWLYNSISIDNLKVKNEVNNIKVVYDKAVVPICVKFHNEVNNKIKEDITEKAQVGSKYTTKDAGDIVDNKGFYWIPTDENKEIIVKDSEVENVIIFKYVPMMSKVTVKYFDDEQNELIPLKQEELQVGSRYKPVVIGNLQSNDGRQWYVDENKIQESVVNKYEEENIIAIYYDKKKAPVMVSFIDENNKSLHAVETVNVQIGSEFVATQYNKIVDYNNYKWMLKASDPKKMVVKERDNRFTLIYGEVKANVWVRCVDIATSNKIAEDITTQVKLGSIYMPNILDKVIDKEKKQWKYVGEKDISLATKENDQENILVLKYEQDKANVTVKYENTKEIKIRKDIVQSVQIGSKIQIKTVPKIKDDNGLVWSLIAGTEEIYTVLEDSDKNVIKNTYVELCSKVIIKYVTEDNTEIIKPYVESIQVGKKYNPEIIDKIIDNNDYVWIPVATNDVGTIVSEDENVITLRYKPYTSKVTLVFVDEESFKIKDEEELNIQVGTMYRYNESLRCVDAKGRYWLQKSISSSALKVSEDIEKNKIFVTYKKEISDVKFMYVNFNKEEIKDAEKIKIQIGETFTPKIQEIIIDKNDMGWEHKLSIEDKYLIKEKAEENIFEIIYEPKLVNVYEKFVDDVSARELKAPNIVRKQIGEKHTANIVQEFVDEVGNEWVHIGKSEIKIFASATKAETIKVSADETKNNVLLKYKPKMAIITIRYEDSLGNIIKKEEKVEAQKGSTYKIDTLERIVDGNGNKWTFNPNCKTSISVSGDEDKDILVLAYEAERATVTLKYQDEEGNRLNPPKKVLAQIGSQYVPEFDKIIEDNEHRIWEYKSRSIEILEVKEQEQENIIVLIFVPFLTNVILSFYDLKEKKILEDMIIKAQLGTTFKPSIDNIIADKNSLSYKFNKCEPESILVAELPIGSNANPNQFKLVYSALYSNVTIKYQDIDGNKLKDDLVEQLQVGEKYTVKQIQYIRDHKENQWGLINNDDMTIRVMENSKENIIKQVYEVAKADIIVRYKDVDGNTIKEDEHFSEQIGNEFVAKTPKSIIDEKSRKWNFFSAEPVNLKVGSINNIVTLIYEEAKATVTTKIEDMNGRKLKDDERELVQIGSRYVSRVIAKVIYDENEIWRYYKSQPEEMVVSENASENVIIQKYNVGRAGNELKVEEKVEEKTKESVNEDKLIIEKEVEHEDIQKRVEKQEVKEQQETNVEQEIIAKTPKEKVEFIDENLKKLVRGMNMTVKEKQALNILNGYNAEIIQILHKNVENYNEQNEVDINEIIRKEKQMIQSEFKQIIEEDKTGNKLLKIFEHIVASERDDKIFFSLQQRKAILIADYFLNKPMTDMEQATFICERGKNNKEIEIVERLMERGIKCNALRVAILYEKILLDNYYKARNDIKDNYFNNEDAKKVLSQEIVLTTSNLMLKQSYSLLTKTTLQDDQKIELEALMELLNSSQIATLNIMVNKIPDGRQRKEAQKLLKQLL